LNKQKDSVNFSSLQSVENNQLSKFAIFETFFLVPFIVLPLTILGIFYIFDHVFGIYDSSIYIYIFTMPFISVPFLLLRTEKSTQKGLELFASISDKVNHHELHKALLILTPLLTCILYHLTNNLVVSLGLSIPIIATQIFTHREMNRSRGLVLLVSPIIFLYFVIDSWIFLYILLLLVSIALPIKSDHDSDKFESLVALPSFVVIAIGTLILAIYTKVYATFSTLSLNSLKSIPKNYKRYLFYIDFRTPPELLPNIEKTNLDDYKYSKILKQNDINKITLFIFTVTLFLPVMFYRYSIKYTALAYLPIAYLFKLEDNNLDGIIRAKSLSALSLFSFGLTVIFLLFSLREFIISKYYSIGNISEAKEFYNSFISHFDTLDLTRVILYSLSIVLFLIINYIYHERKGKKVKPHLAKFYINLLNLSNLTSIFFTAIHYYIFVNVVSS